MIFLYRFSRKLEESSFAGKTADYLLMLLFGATLSIVNHNMTCVDITWCFISLYQLSL
jgi:hypothetical protein